MEHMKNKKNEPENKKAVKEKLKKEKIKEENESFENKEEQKSNKINTFLNKKTDIIWYFNNDSFGIFDGCCYE